MINEVSKPLSYHVPVEKICEKLKKKDGQICELKYGEEGRVRIFSPNKRLSPTVQEVNNNSSLAGVLFIELYFIYKPALRKYVLCLIHEIINLTVADR